MQNKNIPLTASQALVKAANYCAYQERCHSEVEGKLREWKIVGGEAAGILHKLVEQGYLDEERFARAYAGGKFRVKQWGRNRIVQALKMKDVSEYCIRKALTEINENEYRFTLQTLIREALAKHTSLKPPIRKNKAAMYAISRGYEPELVWDILRETG
jgi:regulatory protein